MFQCLTLVINSDFKENLLTIKSKEMESFSTLMAILIKVAFKVILLVG